MNLEKAIHHARLNPITPVGRSVIGRHACVMSDGTTEIVGLNSYKTSPLQARFASNPESIHVHSEISAIQGVIRHLARQRRRHYKDVTDLSDWSMSVARVLKDGTPAMACPCTGCQRAIVAFNIGEVIWTT